MVRHLTISGMNCQHCISAVQNALASTAGVTVLTVDIGSATIETSDAAEKDLVAVIEQEGFSLDEIQTDG